jgi:hypothetical protein
VWKLAFVTTWNTRCGIAEYSRYLVDELDGTRVQPIIFANNARTRRRRTSSTLLV